MKCYVLKVTLEGYNIQRTLAVPADLGFFELHAAIQTAFGWNDFFMHEFDMGGIFIEDDANEESDLLPEKFRYEYEANLEFFLMNTKRFKYIYDIELPKVHDIEVEGVLEDAFDVPVCLGCEGRMIEETLIGDDETVISLGEALTKEDITFLLDSVFNP